MCQRGPFCAGIARRVDSQENRTISWILPNLRSFKHPRHFFVHREFSEASTPQPIHFINIIYERGGVPNVTLLASLSSRWIIGRRHTHTLRRFMSNELRNFLALTYEELEELNLKAKSERKNRVAVHHVQEERLKYLTDEKRIKAVTVLFSDLESRLHMLDYDKKFLIKSWDNLTFDGSSIRGFTAQRES